MSKVCPADAKAHLSELVDRVAGGESVDITRRGNPVDLAMLQALTVSMPAQSQDAATLVRDMRDGDRY